MIEALSALKTVPSAGQANNTIHSPGRAFRVFWFQSAVIFDFVRLHKNNPLRIETIQHAVLFFKIERACFPRREASADVGVSSLVPCLCTIGIKPDIILNC